METAGLVPDVLDREPKDRLVVTFGDNKVVDCGNKLTIENVSQIPTHISWNANPSKFYTLCFTDPDAPSRETPTVREWVHWLVVNIPGGDLSSGETLVEFVPSCPGENSGIHRYTFVLHEQPSKLDFSAVAKFNKSVEHRPLRRHFSIRNFASHFSLGDPAAGNFFTTEWDPYVNIVRKQLGME